ncbi:transketolase family protein [Tritrichomonas foetus]|uniref:transketolase n=1 Tax=Tritrichomonas foetus TaxID=1144522 RepID=A0A1J4JWP2_9EUKA|nr:transketolase family protein [Tritrichomonas foetus]|eukprot:OHT03567.1 transketolase family protein [Tritrichomonas foetus]
MNEAHHFRRFKSHLQIHTNLMFNELDTKIVNTIRILCVDMINKANSGHPGGAMGLSPTAHVLWSRFINFEDGWINRDHFILSCGHLSSLLYSLYHIHTQALTMDDLKSFRQFRAKTAGHPEVHALPIVDATTGPLGQGIANAVGQSIAFLHLAARFNKPDFPIFNNKIWCFTSDGDMMEGISHEAAALAGHLALNNLICFWDDNRITISGSTDLAFTEDVLMRYRAYGWHTISVENADVDLQAIHDAITEALKVEDKPVMIRLHTTIGYGSGLQNTSAVHGAPLPQNHFIDVKKHYGFDPEQSFVVSQDVCDFYAQVRAKTHEKVEAWNKLYADYQAKYPTEYAELQRIIKGDFKFEDFDKFLPKNDEKAAATRVFSGEVLNLIYPRYPGFIGSSADLTPSVNTTLKGSELFNAKCRTGRYFEFGIREHAMQAICNGIAFCRFSGLVPFSSTFFVFSNYMIPAIRIAAIESLRVLMVCTHDSIGVGEDGTTHQPVEGISQLRAMPNVAHYRPANRAETAAAYACALCGKARPSVFTFTRQGVPMCPEATYEGALKGGYIIKAPAEKPKLVLIGTGSELHLVIQAAEKLDFPVQVVSLPCFLLFDEQSLEYRRTVLPKGVATMSVEAGVSYGWHKYSQHHLGVDTYGFSAPGPVCFKEFGFTVENIVAEAKKFVAEFYE